MFIATISRCRQLIHSFAGKSISVTTTPDSDEFGRWYLDLSFTTRLVIYVTVLGAIMFIIFLILKFLSEWDLEAERDRPEVVDREEEQVLIPARLNYVPDEETASSSSSEDIDSAKLCVICFSERKNCFFVPCGHSATCRGCAKKILSDENKACPICRRLIRKCKSKNLLLQL